MTDVTDAELRAHREEMERTKDEPYPSDAPSPTRPGLARSKVLQVRLNPDEYDALIAHASAREIPASTIVRGWILSRLDEVERADDALPAAVDQLAHDVNQLRRLVG